MKSLGDFSLLYFLADASPKAQSKADMYFPSYYSIPIPCLDLPRSRSVLQVPELATLIILCYINARLLAHNVSGRSRLCLRALIYHINCVGQIRF